MPPRGPKPLPAAIHQLRGTFRADRHSEPPAPTSGLPPCPAHLSLTTKREWKRVLSELGPIGLATKLDRSALAAYRQVYARWVETEEQIKTHGVLVKGSKGYPVVSPYLQVANKAIQQMRMLLAEFGMTPSARTRVSATAFEDGEDDPLAEFDPPRRMPILPPRRVPSLGVSCMISARPEGEAYR